MSHVLPLNYALDIEEKSEWKRVKCLYYVKIIGFLRHFTILDNTL